MDVAVAFQDEVAEALDELFREALAAADGRHPIAREWRARSQRARRLPRRLQNDLVRAAKILAAAWRFHGTRWALLGLCALKLIACNLLPSSVDVGRRGPASFNDETSAWPESGPRAGTTGCIRTVLRHRRHIGE